MSIVLDLEPQLEAKLREHAARIGKPLEDYLIDCLENTPDVDDIPTTGPELLAYWDREGLRPLFTEGPDSPALVREWREQEEAERSRR